MNKKVIFLALINLSILQCNHYLLEEIYVYEYMLGYHK